jgi:hypothetical protein
LIHCVSRLDDLVTNGLNKDEIRYLLNRLNGELCQFTKDIYAELPVELLVCIARYLDLDDIMRARRVSRKWNGQFSSPDFCIGVILHHFRGTWEHEYNKSLEGEGEILLEKVRLKDWLPGAVKRRIRRKQGYYYRRYWFHNEYRGDIPHSIQISDERQYSNGRVAFKNQGRIVVKSLDVSISSECFREIPTNANLMTGVP